MHIFGILSALNTSSSSNQPTLVSYLINVDHTAYEHLDVYSCQYRAQDTRTHARTQACIHQQKY